METYAARSTFTEENKLTPPPSRRSFAKPSPAIVPASRKLRRKRSPKRAVVTVRYTLLTASGWRDLSVILSAAKDLRAAIRCHACPAMRRAHGDGTKLLHLHDDES